MAKFWQFSFFHLSSEHKRSDLRHVTVGFAICVKCLFCKEVTMYRIKVPFPVYSCIWNYSVFVESVCLIVALCVVGRIQVRKQQPLCVARQSIYQKWCSCWWLQSEQSHGRAQYFFYCWRESQAFRCQPMSALPKIYLLQICLLHASAFLLPRYHRCGGHFKPSNVFQSLIPVSYT